MVAVTDPDGQAILDGLIALLDLERLEDDLFRGVSPERSPVRVFGGQVAAQSLVASGRTVDPARRVHSLHGYFLRGGDPTIPIVFEVDRARDGSSFSTRRVVAIQRGKPIFTMSSSWQLPEAGLEHALAMPEVRAPEELPTMADLVRGTPGAKNLWASFPQPFDVRYVEQPAWLVTDPSADPILSGKVWFRPRGVLPEDPLLHVCLMAYLSDLTLVETVLARHGVGPGRPPAQVASLDHAMWFHRPVRMDGWVLYDTASPDASGGRGLATGSFFGQDGTQMATVVQEALVRMPRAAK